MTKPITLKDVEEIADFMADLNKQKPIWEKEEEDETLV